MRLCKDPYQPLRWKSWTLRPDSWMRSWHLLLLAMRSSPNSQGSKQNEIVGSFVHKVLRISRQRGQSTAPSLNYLWGSCVLQHRDFSTSAPCLHPHNSPWSVCITGLWELGQWRQLSFTKLEHATVSMLSFLPALCLISTWCPPLTCLMSDAEIICGPWAMGSPSAAHCSSVTEQDRNPVLSVSSSAFHHLPCPREKLIHKQNPSLNSLP